jgi:hypothetical protein
LSASCFCGSTLKYASIAFAVFLFLVGIYEIATNIGYSPLPEDVDHLILIMSLITSILLWMDL